MAEVDWRPIKNHVVRDFNVLSDAEKTNRFIVGVHICKRPRQRQPSLTEYDQALWVHQFCFYSAAGGCGLIVGGTFCGSLFPSDVICLSTTAHTQL